MGHSIDWSKIKHFKPEEFEYPELIKDSVILTLDAMRDSEDNIIITVNSDVRPEDTGYHSKGMAVDVVIRDSQFRHPLPVIQQFLISLRYFWTGVGFYPYWNEPGMHLDCRPMTRFGRRALWWRDQGGVYRHVFEWKWT